MVSVPAGWKVFFCCEAFVLKLIIPLLIFFLKLVKDHITPKFN